jgi:hypothetical protein
VGGKEVSRLVFHELVESVALSPDGRYLVTASVPGETELVVSLDPSRPQDLIDEACSRLTANLTQEEWKRFLPDQKYRKTCPNLP